MLFLLFPAESALLSLTPAVFCCCSFCILSRYYLHVRLRAAELLDQPLCSKVEKKQTLQKQASTHKLLEDMETRFSQYQLHVIQTESKGKKTFLALRTSLTYNPRPCETEAIVLHPQANLNVLKF